MTTTNERRVALTTDHIVSLVKSAQDARASLRARFEADYALFQLEWSDDRWPDGKPPEGYESFTSNEPRVFADRVVGMLVSAQLNAQIPVEGNLEDERKLNQKKEQFFAGVLRKVDQAQLQKLMPKLRDQLAFYVSVRGWYCGRALLVKQGDGSTKIAIDIFDPMHTYYGMGSDGLKWVCHVTKRTRDEIYEEYGLDLTGGDAAPQGSLNNSDAVGIDVYDWYDETHRAVAVRDSWALEPEEHSAGHVPCFFGMVGPVPPIVRKDSSNRVDNIDQVGESLFGANRRLYAQWNKTMSDLLSLVRRSLRPPIVYQSQDGSKTIEGDPWRTGAELGIAQGESVKALELLKMSPDTSALLGSMSGEMQRGSIPHTVYGEIEFQLSGYAINTLRQGLDLAIQNTVSAMENAYRQISWLICSQYASGGYAPLKLNGYNRQAFFNAEIQPREIAAVEDDLEIGLLPHLPTDDIAAYQMADIAMKSGLLSARTIRERILKLQNVDQEDKLIKEAMAEKANPLAALITLINACLEMGRQDLALVYIRELGAALALRGELPEEYLPKGAGFRGAPSMNGGPGQEGPGQSGFDPRVAPPATNGIAPAISPGSGARTGLPQPPQGLPQI